MGHAPSNNSWVIRHHPPFTFVSPKRIVDVHGNPLPKHLVSEYPVPKLPYRCLCKYCIAGQPRSQHDTITINTFQGWADSSLTCSLSHCCNRVHVSPKPQPQPEVKEYNALPLLAPHVPAEEPINVGETGDSDSDSDSGNGEEGAARNISGEADPTI